MKVRLSKNSFVRIFDNGKLGYINNQLTKHDRCYNDTGADFLSQITRNPKSFNDIIKSLSFLYADVSIEEIKEDFLSFIDDLHKERYICIGENNDEIENDDLSFSYTEKNYKKIGISDDSTKIIDTESFFFEHDWKSHRLAQLEVELTSKCNERCIHCYIPNEKKNHGYDMPLSMVYKIIDQFRDMGGLNIELSGGEALLHKNLPDILRYCRKKDLQIALLTNLALLKDELIPIIKETNLSVVQVSLYSMNPVIHDYITTIKGSFEKTKSAIEKLHANDIPIQISCPIMKVNQDGYKDVLKYAQSLNIKAQTDFVMMAQADLNTQNLDNRLSIEETERLIRDQIIPHDVDYQAHIADYNKSTLNLFSNVEEFKNRPICGAGFNSVCVTSNGDLYPCSGWQGMVLGNINHSDLKDIWEKSEKLKIIRGYTYKDFPKCIECESRDYCNICLVRNFNESGGDPLKINEHFCKVAYLNKKLVEEYNNESTNS